MGEKRKCEWGRTELELSFVFNLTNLRGNVRLDVFLNDIMIARRGGCVSEINI